MAGEPSVPFLWAASEVKRKIHSKTELTQDLEQLICDSFMETNSSTIALLLTPATLWSCLFDIELNILAVVVIRRRM